MLISIETHRTCDSPGGGSGHPIPPLDLHMPLAIFLPIFTLSETNTLKFHCIPPYSTSRRFARTRLAFPVLVSTAK